MAGPHLGPSAFRLQERSLPPPPAVCPGPALCSQCIVCHKCQALGAKCRARTLQEPPRRPGLLSGQPVGDKQWCGGRWGAAPWARLLLQTAPRAERQAGLCKERSPHGAPNPRHRHAGLMRMHPMLEGLTDLTPRATDDENLPALAPHSGSPLPFGKPGPRTQSQIRSASRLVTASWQIEVPIRPPNGGRPAPGLTQPMGRGPGPGAHAQGQGPGGGPRHVAGPEGTDPACFLQGWTGPSPVGTDPARAGAGSGSGSDTPSPGPEGEGSLRESQLGEGPGLLLKHGQGLGVAWCLESHLQPPLSMEGRWVPDWMRESRAESWASSKRRYPGQAPGATLHG